LVSLLVFSHPPDDAKPVRGAYSTYFCRMPELPELEALRIRIAPRVEGKLITAATVNPKKAHLLRYPVDNFALELPARRITSLTRRGKHLVFATQLGGGGSPRWLVINPMLGG